MNLRHLLTTKKYFRICVKNICYKANQNKQNKENKRTNYSLDKKVSVALIFKRL